MLTQGNISKAQVPEGWEEIADESPPMARMIAKTLCPVGNEQVQIRIITHLHRTAQLNSLAAVLEEFSTPGFQSSSHQIEDMGEGRQALWVEGTHGPYALRRALFCSPEGTVNEVALLAPLAEIDKYADQFGQFLRSVRFNY